MTVKKRTLILWISIAVLFALVVLSMVIQGSCYTMHTHSFYADDVDIKDYTCTLEPEGIIEPLGVRIEKGEVVLDFKAVGRGSVSGSFTYKVVYPDGNYFNGQHTADFKVNAFGIFELFSEGWNVNFNSYRFAVIAIILSLFLTEFTMLANYNTYRKKGQFNYSMVASGGVAIYIVVVILAMLYKMHFNAISSFPLFLFVLRETGFYLLLMLAPVMMVMALFLLVSNLWLIKNEGRRPVNMLGIFFAIVWFMSSIFIFDPRAKITTMVNSTWVGENLYYIRLYLGYIASYFECLFLSTALSAFLATKHRPGYDKDFIIILGCGIRKDGSLTPLLRGRVDSALDFEKEQFEASGKHAVFVPSGGQGTDEVIPEGEAMERYLCEKGVPKERILLEDKSVNTYQNMQFSKNIIEKNCGDVTDKRISFATTNYHIFRGYILAKKNGFYADGISAKTKMYFYPNAFLREFAGLLMDRKWNNLAVVIIIVLFFGFI
ncbi:MAG: YdcF family protein [Lachnospiraceae bacterium]|nr:YdcF family protein [Lachnospiraceae bacterium]